MFTYKYPHPAVTADCIVFAKNEKGMKVLLIQRGNEPCKGKWAFPGGFMNIDETTAEAARRELKEETGLSVGEVFQVGAFDAVDRDPRERVITVAYYTVIDKESAVAGDDDAAKAEWFPIDSLPQLAFDHAEILAKALAMVSKADGAI